MSFSAPDTAPRLRDERARSDQSSSGISRRLREGGWLIDRVASVALRGMVLGYRYLVSPFAPPTCRFAPSCSAYALEALAQHGALKGGWLALRRILRCHPWGGSGFDPVPAAARSRHGHEHARQRTQTDASHTIGRPL